MRLLIFCYPIFIVSAFIVGMQLSSCSSERSRTEDSVVYNDSIERENEITDNAWDWVDSVMDGMTDEELVGQLLMPAMFARTSPEELGRLREYVLRDKVGGIVLLKGDVGSVAQISDTLRRMSPQGIFLAIDAENGLRMRLHDAPELPWNGDMGKVADDQLMYEFGREISRECRAIGISMVLGPVMDVVPGEGSKAISGRRSLGSDAHRVADLSVAYARGVEDGGVISVAKHFPGHGSASADSHKGIGVISSEAVRLDSIDLYPFRRYAEELLSGVMIGHLSATSLDTIARPAVVSPVLMQDILRSRLGFGGLVLTDALNMEGALGVTAWEAIAAGADIVLAPTDTRAEIRKALAALESGELSREVLTNRVRRVLFYKYLAGLPESSGVDVANSVAIVNDMPGAVRDSLSMIERRITSFRYPDRSNIRHE